MPLNSDAILAYPFETFEQSVSDRDCMLFALSVGLGRDPLDVDELPYVYEGALKVFPTQAIVLGHPGPWMAGPGLGINRQMLVHGTQRLELLADLVPDQPFLASNRVIELVDKGPEGGAIIVLERVLKDAATGALIARIESGTFCRADGGFGGSRVLSREFRTVPERKSDAMIEMSTDPRQALWYRLNGDRNPLHADPGFAASAGFPRPILHGLCTYSVAAHALLKLHPGRRLRLLETRFSKPVYPGETVRVEAWALADGIAFQARAVERDVVVLDRGFAQLD
jgi:acyl dehydratase